MKSGANTVVRGFSSAQVTNVQLTRSGERQIVSPGDASNDEYVR